MRSANGSPVGYALNLLPGDVHAEVHASRSTILAAAVLASSAEFPQEVLKACVLHVDEVPKHVDLVVGDIGAQFDCGDDLDAVLDRGGLSLGDALGGVVVAYGDDPEAVTGTEVDELGRSEGAVGVGCVEMEVYFVHFVGPWGLCFVHLPSPPASPTTGEGMNRPHPSPLPRREKG